MPVTETLDGQLTLPRIPYSIVTLLLDDARNNELVVSNIESDFLCVVDLVNPVSAPISLRLNYPNAAPIPLEAGRAITCPPEFLKKRYAAAGIVVPPPVRKLYLTHGAIPGGKITIGIGGDASFEMSSSGTVIVVGISTIVSQLATLIAMSASELQRAITGVDLSAVLASTTVPLGIGATWVSGWFLVDRYGQVVFTAVADRGMNIHTEFSWDGITVDAVESFAYPGPGGALGTGDGRFSYVVAPYARVRATNTSGLAQTSLRLMVGGRAI